MLAIICFCRGLSSCFTLKKINQRLYKFRRGSGRIMKKIVVFLILISVTPCTQACFFVEAFHFLTCNCFRFVPSELELLCDIRHRDCYERGLYALLDPIYVFLLQQKVRHSDVPAAVVFNIDETSFYHDSIEPKRAVFAFYHKLRATGFSVVFISTRPASNIEATRKQLFDAGYIGFLDIRLMPNELYEAIKRKTNPNAQIACVREWKTMVRAAIEREHVVRIVATLDDEPAFLNADSCGLSIIIG